MEISMEHLKAYVIDRFEGSYAILEDNKARTYDVLRDQLPPDVREGDILHENGGIYEIDEKATEEERERLQRIGDALANGKR